MLDRRRAIQLEGGDWVKKYSLVLSAPRMEEILSNNSKEENMAVSGGCSSEVTRRINNSKQSGERTGSIGERDLATGNTQNSDTVLMCSSICLRWVTDSKDS